MRARWEAASGATGYLLLYEPVNATVSSTEKEVRNAGLPANFNKISEIRTSDNMIKRIFFLELFSSPPPFLPVIKCKFRAINHCLAENIYIYKKISVLFFSDMFG